MKEYLLCLCAPLLLYIRRRFGRRVKKRSARGLDAIRSRGLLSGWVFAAIDFCAITSGQQILTNQEIDNVGSGRVRSSSIRRAEQGKKRVC